jgi:hypothetical protein
LSIRASKKTPDRKAEGEGRANRLEEETACVGYAACQRGEWGAVHAALRLVDSSWSRVTRPHVMFSMTLE